MPSVFIKTYGCQMNERDSEAVAAQLVAKGYSMTSDALRADARRLDAGRGRAALGGGGLRPQPPPLGRGHSAGA